MKKILILVILFCGVIYSQTVQDSTVYKLTYSKYIDGIDPCTYVKVDYKLDDSTLVGSYGVIDSVFIPLYLNATIPKNSLIDYEDK